MKDSLFVTNSNQTSFFFLNSEGQQSVYFSLRKKDRVLSFFKVVEGLCAPELKMETSI